MTDFKILAIKPLKECNSKYLKNLKPEQIFYFYSHYTIKEDTVIENTTTGKKILNLYSSNVGPKINISAIVGGNGSGKSTIVELLIAAINNIAKNNIKDKLISDKLEEVNDLHLELYFKTDTFYKIIITKENIKYFNCHKEGETFKEISKGTENNLNLNDFFYTIGVNYSHYALNSNNIGDWITELFHKNDGYQTPMVLNPMRTKGNININDENHLVFSRLITNLLKPKENGEKENAITDNQTAKQIFFLFNPNKIEFADKFRSNITGYNEYELTFSELYERNNNKEDNINWKQEILKTIFSSFNISKHKDTIPYYDEICDYIIKKLISISNTYTQYIGYYNSLDEEFKECDITTEFGRESGSFKEYLYKLNLDKSHVTFKLRQALNYISNNPLKDIINNSERRSDKINCLEYYLKKYNHLRGVYITYNSITYKINNDYYEDEYRYLKASSLNKEILNLMINASDLESQSIEINISNNQDIHGDYIYLKKGSNLFKLNNPSYFIDIDELSEKLNVIKKEEIELIELIPPSIFEYDISLITKDKKANNNPSMFSELSSGEKQLIHSMSSVSYHLINLESVFNNHIHNKESNKLITYKHANILFDEVEIYHHPNMQRKLVKHIIDSINNLNLKKIKAINVCFVTHSPFILSDIPESNTLFLEVKDGLASPKDTKPETFGANIHELLYNSFFMQEGMLGAFITEKIRSIISYSKNQKSEIETNEEASDIINLISEPLIKNKLQTLIENKATEENDIEYFKQKIKDIEAKQIEV